MVEAARRRSRLLSLARSLNPLKTKQPTPTVPETYVAAQELPTAIEQRLTTIHSGSESSRSSYDGPPPLADGSRVSPDSICPICLNLGQQVWNELYREEYGLGEPERHLMPADDVCRTAMQGCSGCQIIAWALEPFMKQPDGMRKKVRICFDKWYYPVIGGITFHKLEFYIGSLPVDKVFTEIAIKHVAYKYKLGQSAHS